MKRVTDFPQHVSDAHVQKPQSGTMPLIDEWQQKHQPVEHKTKIRPLTQTDMFPPNEYDEILDWEDEQERMWKTIIVLEVPREREDFVAARKELYLILRLYEDAGGLWQTRYQRDRARLIEAGYSEKSIASVPEPPNEVPLLHPLNNCNGEIWEGYPDNGMEHPYSHMYCLKCGWIQKRWDTPTVESLRDKKPVTIPADPDHEEYRFASSYDEGPDPEAGKENLIRTRRCLKAAGVLISVSEAAQILGCSTNNVSNYIAKNRLGAWPDPDDTRYRLVLRREVEELR